MPGLNKERAFVVGIGVAMPWPFSLLSVQASLSRTSWFMRSCLRPACATQSLQRAFFRRSQGS